MGGAGSVNFIGCSQDIVLISVDKCVVIIFFLEENIIYLQRKRHICWLVAPLPWKHIHLKK